MENLSWLEWFHVFQYIFNFWLIAIPWTVYGFWSVMWNIFLNVDFNRDWAGGNFLLMGITIIMILQYILSLFLFYEIDSVLRHIKFIRLLALMYSWGFNIVYALSAVKFLYMIRDYSNTPYGEADWFDLYICMTIGYNLILHGGNFNVNSAIIIKEFSLEYF